MSLSRGALKIGMGFAATYALIWGNWERMAEAYNERQFERIEHAKMRKQLAKERAEMLAESS